METKYTLVAIKFLKPFNNVLYVTEIHLKEMVPVNLCYTAQKVQINVFTSEPG